MGEVKPYIQNLFAGKGIAIGSNRINLFENFINLDNSINTVKQIFRNQATLIEMWKLLNRITDIKEQPINIPNGTVGKSYNFHFDKSKLKWDDIIFSEFEGLEEIGLAFDAKLDLITGTPKQSGDLHILFKFKLEGEPKETELNIKEFKLIINPDPKSLWKNVESDSNDKFWKKDSETTFSSLGTRHLIVSSIRGRSHANVGTFREDDFSFRHLNNSEWSIVSVADGAGSAKLSREGSKIACNEIINYLTEQVDPSSWEDLDFLINEYNKSKDEIIQKKIYNFLYSILGKATFHVYQKLESTANKLEISLKDLHSTLIFVLIKKYDFGYAILSFGVGDCPIGLINSDKTEVKLLNWLDVGDFGGGTRFITMPEIFQSEKFYSRFAFHLINDFSYLMLMTDGIYDPKFVVEANLDKIEKWREFLSDLDGNNENGFKVEFDPNNKNITDQLSNWMEFWSTGNHDDRTLAIIF
jgi:serine/threonine protein phosphatase PrpC